MNEPLRREALRTANELRATGEPHAHAHAEAWAELAYLIDEAPRRRKDVKGDKSSEILIHVGRVLQAVRDGELDEALARSSQTLKNVHTEVLHSDERFLTALADLPGNIKTPLPGAIKTPLPRQPKKDPATEIDAPSADDGT